MSQPVRSGLPRSNPPANSRRRSSSAKISPQKPTTSTQVPGWTCRACGTHNTEGALQCHGCDGHLPSITLFKAHMVIEGRIRYTRVSWDTEGAQSVRINPGRSDLPSSGIIELEAETDTVFTLIAGNGIGTRKITTSITLAPPRILRFEAANPEIQIGYPTILSWEVENAASIRINRGIGNVTGRTFIETYLESAEPVILTVSNEQGKDEMSIQLHLPLPEIRSFYAGATHIPREGSVPIYWQVANAKDITLNPFETEEALEPLGSAAVRPSRNTEYVLTVRNASGSCTERLTIEVPAPKINVFGSPNGVSTEGEAVLLTWEVDFAEEIRLEPDIGLVPPMGSTWITPKQAFTFFTLTAKGASGAVTETYQVTRFPIPLESALLLLPDETETPMATQSSDKTNPLHDLAQMERDIQALSQAQIRDLHIQQAKEKKLTYDLLDMKKASIRKELKKALARIKHIFNS